MQLTEAQYKSLVAAVSALGNHAGACGHKVHDDDCPYCDDNQIYKVASKVLEKGHR